MSTVTFEDSTIKIDKKSIRRFEEIRPGYTFNKDRDKFYYADLSNIYCYDLLTGENLIVYSKIESENYLYLDPHNEEQLYIIIFEKSIRFLMIDLLNFTIKDRCRVVDSNTGRYIFLTCFFFPQYLLIFTTKLGYISINVFCFNHRTRNSFLGFIPFKPEENTKLFCDDKMIYYSDQYRSLQFPYIRTEKSFSIETTNQVEVDSIPSKYESSKVNLRFCYRLLPLLRVFKLLKEEYPLVFDKIVIFEIIRYLNPRIKQNLFQVLFDYTKNGYFDKEDFDRFLLYSLF